MVEAEIIEDPEPSATETETPAPQPEPDRITGMDGKSYKASTTPPARRRRPWPDAYNEAVRKVTAAAVTLQNLAGDDRATKHSSQPYMLNELRRAIESLNATMQVLDQ